MNPFIEPVSTWIEALHRQVVRAKHILLHGNTADLALYSGLSSSSHPKPDPVCTKFDTALHRYLVDAGFKLVLHCNAADGPKLVDATMLGEFSSALAAPGAPGVQHDDLRLNSSNLSDAAETIHQLLRQKNVPVAVVMHFADKVVGSPDNHGPDELSLLVRIKQSLEDGEFAAGQTGLRNTLICVASQLTAVPGWLYVENPRISLVQVGRPTAPERRSWIKTRVNDFYRVANLASAQRDELVIELAGRTDGMTLFEISLLPRVSHAEQIELTSQHELVRAARFGKKEDPWRELDRKRLESAEQLLRKRVKGQEAAVAHVVGTLRRAYVGVDVGSDRARGGPPRGIFFFVGPTGVGKTELSKSIAELIFGDDDRMKVFDMAEFHADHSVDRLVGAPPGYKDCERGGQLTNHVLSEPFSVILFDEMEKAHPSINDKFLGILEEGRLTDGRGITAYFDQSILVFTSNIGSDALKARLLDKTVPPPDYDELRKLYLKAAKAHFTEKLGRPELLGRFGDNLIVFDMLRPELVAQLCGKLLAELRDSARRERQIELDLDERSISAYMTARMREPDNLELGGRRIRELIRTTVVRPLAEYLFQKNLPRDSKVRLSVNPDDGCIDIKP